MSLCTHGNPKEQCVNCRGTFRAAAKNAKDDLLDAVIESIAARIEKINKRPLSDAAKEGLKALKPATLAELLNMQPNGDAEPAPKKPESPYATPMRDNSAAPAPIDQAPIIKANHAGTPLRKALLGRKEKK